MLKRRVITSLVMSCALLSGAHAAYPAKSANPNLAPAVPPLIILAPTEVRTDPTLAKGCWIRLFPGKDYKGNDDLTIAGPLELPSLHTPLGTNWKHKAQSMIVGPSATVTIYENQKLRGKHTTFKPGAQVTDLRAEMNQVETIDSLKLVCEK